MAPPVRITLALLAAFLFTAAAPAKHTAPLLPVAHAAASKHHASPMKRASKAADLKPATKTEQAAKKTLPPKRSKHGAAKSQKAPAKDLIALTGFVRL